jgi:hypothetical protein
MVRSRFGPSGARSSSCLTVSAGEVDRDPREPGPDRRVRVAVNHHERRDHVVEQRADWLATDAVASARQGVVGISASEVGLAARDVANRVVALAHAGSASRQP